MFVMVNKRKKSVIINKIGFVATSKRQEKNFCLRWIKVDTPLFWLQIKFI